MGAEWPSDLDKLISPHLAAQRWFAGSGIPEPGTVRVVRAASLWSGEGGSPQLWQALVSAGPDVYQLIVGERPAGERAEFLNGHESGVLGVAGDSYFYDATLDPELSKALLAVASGGKEEASRARPLTAEQSNSSLVFDDRLILKVFRRLRAGRNPDVEVTTALAHAGFTHVAQPLVDWRDDEYDLGFGQQFLTGGTEGWALAITSLRDLYNDQETGVPAEAGGDFAAEAERLGRVTAEMHLALRGIFGVSGAGGGWSALVDGLPKRLELASEVAHKDFLEAAAALIARLRAIADPGPSFRVHGDFHLGQVMRTDLGWYVLDFEGEPARPLADRVAPCSPLKDVTGMLRSFHYASRHALVEWPPSEWSDLEPLARAWDAHNRQAFLDGYQEHPEIPTLLPDAGAAPAVMAAYELDKALYELDYELSHRPEWVAIPIDALDRLIHGGA
jgi:maltokinase